MKNANIKHRVHWDEWFLYIVDGEKWYYKEYQNPQTDFIGYKDVSFLGIARPNSPPHREYGSIIKEPKAWKPKKTGIQKINNFWTENLTCCYCEITLQKENYTREHVIPKHRGGRIIKPCCKKCNFEKGGLMLHSYIQLLNSKLLDYKGELLIELQTKIKNANRLAKEIENTEL